MNQEILKAPSGLCAHHRVMWKRATARGAKFIPATIVKLCTTGQSTRCSTEHESER